MVEVPEFEVSELRAAQARAAESLTQCPKPATTWHSLSRHWLQSPLAAELEREAQARRLAAVERWRGLREAAAYR